MKSDIVFIILTYFPNPEKLLSLIDSLKPFVVVLVDNTPDKNQELGNRLKEQNKKIPSHAVYIPNGKNLGYTGGVNVGLKQAMSKDPSWIVILNDDLVLNKKIVEDFSTKLVSSSIGLAGPYPRYFDQKRWTTTTIYKDDSTKPDFLSGSFLAIHKNVINQLGYLYEPYFIFYEEVEYCVRAKKAGFPLTPLGIDGIEHKESSTFEKRPFLHQYYLARNHMLFVQRNAPLQVKMYEAIRFPKTMLEHLTKHESGGIEGIKDFLLRKFGPHPRSL